MKQLFAVTSKLVREQTEIQGRSLVDWQQDSWKRTTLLTDRAVRLSTAKAHVFSDSVLCMGRISADILSKGNFTRDEWNSLLHLFNISHFSLLCCSQNFSLTSCTKRMQEQEGEDRIVAKSKPTTMNLAFTVSTSSSTVQNPVASKSPEMLKAPCRTDWSSTRKPDAKKYNQEAKRCSSGCRYEETRRFRKPRNRRQ